MKRVSVLCLLVAAAPPLAGQQDSVATRPEGEQPSIGNPLLDPRHPDQQRLGTAVERRSLPDRWRRLDPAGVIVSYSLLDPYGQNPLKGDFAVIGQNTFSVLTLVANPAAALSSQQGVGPQLTNRMLGAFELFNGLTVFRPKTWSLRASAQGLFNRGNANLDELRLLEAFGEAKLFDVGASSFDFTSARFGVQAFASDFNGLIFNDINLGGRLFGEVGRNRYRWTLAGFSQRQKSPGNGITFDSGDQTVLIGNIVIEDFLTPGFLGAFSAHAALDQSVPGNDLRVVHLGFTSDGRMGRVAFNPTLYLAFGREAFNSVAQQEVSIRAFLAGLQLAYRRNWLNYRAALFVASGDDDPTDGNATGFDAVLDNVVLFGGAVSPVIGGALFGTRPNSFLPANRVGVQGSGTRANFVNPGMQLANAGVDAVVSPKVFVGLNYNFFRFFDTAVFDAAGASVANELGHEVNAALRFRAFLDENVVFQLGGAALFPASGGRDLLGGSGAVFSGNFALVLAY